MQALVKPTHWRDEDGYPTEEALEYIRRCDYTEVVDAVVAAWNTRYGSVQSELSPAERDIVDEDGSFVRLATGGWSGNEDVIAAHSENIVGSAITWRLSACGGLHILKRP